MSALLEAFMPVQALAAFEADLAAVRRAEDCVVLSRRLYALQLAMHVPEGDGRQIARWISQLNDRLSERVITLMAVEHRLPAVDWCWLALGSEGRHEQTWLTDQDNALIFTASDTGEANVLRELFLPFAKAVNHCLAECGFTLCPGDIMAGNPACCLSLDEWAERFIDWVRRPDPQALLNASIFFDLRPLVGRAQLAERLRKLLLDLSSDTPAFLHLMAANALAAEVPLGFRGEVKLDALDSVDLKKFGSRIFVDAARIFALAAACPAVSTEERLRLAGPANGLSDDEVRSVCAAFSHVLRLRLGLQQADISAGRALGYGVKPAELHEVDQVILRESLRQARRLQQRLRLNYSL